MVYSCYNIWLWVACTALRVGHEPCALLTQGLALLLKERLDFREFRKLLFWHHHELLSNRVGQRFALGAPFVSISKFCDATSRWFGCRALISRSGVGPHSFRREQLLRLMAAKPARRLSFSTILR